MASLNPGEGSRISDLLSDAGSQEDEDEDEDAEFTYPVVGDYSTQLEEMFDGEEAEQRSNDDDEDFLYDGVDTSISYKDQLREVLGQGDEDEKEEKGVGESLVHENGASHDDDEPLVCVHLSMNPEFANYCHRQQHSNVIFFEGSPYASSSRVLSPESRISSPDPKLNPLKLSKPFLHPTVSRLRSFVPQSSKVDSNEDSLTSQSRGGASPATSGFSISRRSSTSNSPYKRNGTVSPGKTQEVFKWTELNVITQTVYSKASQKASAVLGAPLLGSPTVLAANGLICIGTTEGKIAVYDFKQTLVCVCDSTMPGTFLHFAM
jgi:hypothetical protein